MSDAEPVLKRELTDISDEVRAVPPPPTPMVAAPYAFRLVDPDADAAMIAEWMNRPHLAQAWEYDWPVPRWHRYLRAQLDGSYSRPFIGSRHGQDLGYIELYRAAKDSVGRLYRADPYDIGMHAAIADLRIVNRGLGPILFPRIAASVFELEERCRRIIFEPDYDNAAARRLCEFTGCAFLGEHAMNHRRVALYALPRSSDDIPEIP